MIDHLALREGGQILSFEELPEEAQLALARYMSLDGEAWEVPPALEAEFDEIGMNFGYNHPEGRQQTAAALRDAIPSYIARYGDFEIGYHPCIPTEKLMNAMMIQLEEDPMVPPMTLEEFHEWYLNSSGVIEEHDVTKPLWPVILSSFDDEVLQDGAHRFHHYVNMGVSCIPALYYVS